LDMILVPFLTTRVFINFGLTIIICMFGSYPFFKMSMHSGV
jgi:hypothetical protein